MKQRKKKFRSWNNYEDIASEDGGSSDEEIVIVKKKKVHKYKSRKPSNKLSGWNTAIIKVLVYKDDGMTCKDIWNEIKRRNLFKTDGKTPWCTISCKINDNIRKHGKESIFEKVKPGVYKLR